MREPKCLKVCRKLCKKEAIKYGFPATLGSDTLNLLIQDRLNDWDEFTYIFHATWITENYGLTSKVWNDFMIIIASIAQEHIGEPDVK